MKRTPMPARTKPMPRRKPLASSKPLARSAGLTQVTPLQRTTRIKPVSKKRAAENRLRRALANELFPERPRCARKGCTRLADDIHEILPRGRGGSITDPSIWVPLCRQDHDEATNEAQWAYDEGLLIHSWEAVA